MLSRGIKGSLRLFWLVPDKVLISTVREALVGFEGLSIGQRILVAFGYISIFALLGLTLAVEFLSDQLTLVTFATSDKVKEIPKFVMVFSVLGFGLGGAFILTGATDCRRRIFLPVAALFAFLFLLFAPFDGHTLFIVGYCLILLFMAGLMGVYLFTRGRRFWSDWPLAEFVLWLGLIAVLVALFWFSKDTTARARSLDGAFSLLFLLTILFLAVSGLAVVDAAVKLAHTVIVALRKLFPGEFLRVLAAALTVIRPILSVSLIFIGAALDIPTGVLAGVIIFEFFLTTPLVFLLIGVAVLRRWNTRNALTVLGLSFATPVFALGLSLGLFGGGQDISDPLEMALQGVGLFPEVLVFVGLMALSVLSAGASFAQSDGRYMPRSGRLMLGLGFALLVTTITFYGVNLDTVSGDETPLVLENFVDQMFVLGALFLGVPYLVWITWKRRDDLVGVESDFAEREPIFGGLRRVSGPVWMVGAMMLALVPACCVCMAAVLLAGAVSP